MGMGGRPRAPARARSGGMALAGRLEPVHRNWIPAPFVFGRHLVLGTTAIIDKQWGRWYAALNLALEKSLTGLNSNKGFEFDPSAKLSFELTHLVAIGVEYYTALRPLGHFGTWEEQQHQLFPTLDLNFSPNWEFNFGVGFGLTASTDNLLVKLIIGYRF